jgi:hypothetical protein
MIIIKINKLILYLLFKKIYKNRMIWKIQEKIHRKIQNSLIEMRKSY